MYLFIYFLVNIIIFSNAVDRIELVLNTDILHMKQLALNWMSHDPPHYQINWNAHIMWPLPAGVNEMWRHMLISHDFIMKHQSLPPSSPLICQRWASAHGIKWTQLRPSGEQMSFNSSQSNEDWAASVGKHQHSQSSVLPEWLSLWRCACGRWVCRARWCPFLRPGGRWEGPVWSPRSWAWSVGSCWWRGTAWDPSPR